MTTWRPLRGGGEPSKVGESLDRISRWLGGPKAQTAAAVFERSRWQALVGPDIAAHAKPVTLRGGILTLAVDDPAWAAQLKFMTEQLIARISEATGTGEIKEIHLRVVG